MSQRYIALSSFKYGLDSRRDVLSSVPGTLTDIVNGFINAGGEIEQRQSFVKDANLYPTNTVGLQDTDSGLVTFGSDAAPNAALPTGVTYQQLAAPSGAGQISFVYFSCNFLGKAFAIVGFDLSNCVFFYYNGVLVAESRAGEVLAADTITTLASELAALYNNLSGWLATPGFVVKGGVNSAYVGGVVVESPSQVHFTPVPTYTSPNGILSATLVDQNGTGSAAKGASVAFTINAGTSGTIVLTAPAKQDGTGTAQLTGGPVNFNTSINQTAADVVTAITLFGAATGYSAVASGATVTVYAPSAWGNFTFNLTVVTTGTLTTVGGVVATNFTITATPTFVDVIKLVTIANSAATVTGHCLASSSGAAGAVTYSWQECNPNGSLPVTTPTGVILSGANTNYATFSKFLLRNTDVFAYYLLTVVDAGGPTTKTLVVQVHLECNNTL